MEAVDIAGRRRRGKGGGSMAVQSDQGRQYERTGDHPGTPRSLLGPLMVQGAEERNGKKGGRHRGRRRTMRISNGKSP